jgi:aspartate/tyrosine/aromatic aminotransferase
MHFVLKAKFGKATWKTLPLIPKDPIMTYNLMYHKDTNLLKVNLTIGAYNDASGKAWVLPSVKMAIDQILVNDKFNCSYLPLTGDVEFTQESIKLAYGFDSATNLLSNNIPLNRVARTQTISGAGGVFLAFTFVINQYAHFDGNVYLPNATWPIHNSMASVIGLKVNYYHYYDFDTRSFDFEIYLDSLRRIPERSFVVLHCSGHNPTGFDPSTEQWQQIAQLVKEREFLILMDNAYQGFVSGDLEIDGYPIRLFVKEGIPMMVSQSFAKNMGLYGQRAGCFSVIFDSEEQATQAQTYFGYRNRNVYSNPPRFGSDIAKILLQDSAINAQWRQDIKFMANSIVDRRKALHSELAKLGLGDEWEYLVKQKGMFAFTHLKQEEIRTLRDKYAIYMLECGRISVPGLSSDNAGYVAKALAAVTMKQ